MKIRLLNDGGFAELSSINFPVEVNGDDWLGNGFDVRETEFDKFGLKLRSECDDNMFYFSLANGECEVAE